MKALKELVIKCEGTLTIRQKKWGLIKAKTDNKTPVAVNKKIVSNKKAIN